MTRLEDRIWFIVNEKEDDVCLITDNTNKCLKKFDIAPGVLDAMTPVSYTHLTLPTIRLV